MSKELVLLTPSTVPTLIVRKLDDLGSEPKKADLNVIRELLDVVQEERLVSNEEVQEWKRTEKKVLENQNDYKKETKSIKKLVTSSIRFFKFFTLPMVIFLTLFVVISCTLRALTDELLLRAILENKISRIIFKLLVSWPINFIAVFIYLYHLYGSDFVLNFGSKHQLLKNEEKDDDWEYPLTSTELLSRQKFALNKWEQLRKERKGNLNIDFLPNLPRFINVLYFFIRFSVINELRPKLTESEYLIEYYSSFIFLIIFFVHCSYESDLRKEVRKEEDDYQWV